MIVTFPTAKLAKEKGFKEKVYAFYKIPKDEKKFLTVTLEYAASDYDERETFVDTIYDYNSHIMSYDYENKEFVSAPTQAQLQKWLRVKNVHVNVLPPTSHKGKLQYICMIQYGFIVKSTEAHTEYENCLEEGLLIGLKETVKMP